MSSRINKNVCLYGSQEKRQHQCSDVSRRKNKCVILLHMAQCDDCNNSSIRRITATDTVK